MSTIPVLLVEDDDDLREALTEYLELNGCTATAVASGLAFYSALSDGCDFHVGVIDLGLPDQDGHVLAEYARRNTSMSVIIVTANDTLDNRVETYRTGADLFIGKPVDSRELLAAIRALDERYCERGANPPATPEAGEPGVSEKAWRLDVARRRLLAPGERAIDLNPNETRVCELFSAAGHDNVERRVLMDQIYGRDDNSAQRALDNLIRRLRHKIVEGSGRSDPILTAYGIGYSFSEPLHLL